MLKLLLPTKTPHLHDFDYHLDHMLMVELMAGAFASGALRGVFVRAEYERIRWLQDKAVSERRAFEG